MLHKTTNKKYYVIPYKNSLKVIDNDWVKAYNRLAKKHNQGGISYNDLLRESYYITSNGTTNHRIKSFPKQKSNFNFTRK
jgi:hypothetical protein